MAIARRQHGVLRRDQLESAGVGHNYARDQVKARRWVEIGRNLVVTQNAELSRRQVLWAAVLDSGGRSALASHTALELCGFRGFGREAELVHVVVDRGQRYTTLAGVVVHESRRLHDCDLVRTDGLRRTRAPRSAIDAAAWQPWPRFACATLAAVVQQRICTVVELDEAMARVGRVRHKAHMRLALADIAGGAEAMGEIDIARLCRTFGLPLPDRQVPRLDSAGRRRFLDCEWKLVDGSIVVLEVDGSHHMDVKSWDDDLRRERKIVTSRRWVLRASTTEVRLDPADIVRDLVALGVPCNAQSRALVRLQWSNGSSTA